MAIIMSLNLRSKLKPVLNLCRAFSNAPLPDVCSKDKKSKFIVAQHTKTIGQGCSNYLVISIGDTAHEVEKNINYPKLYHKPVATCNGLMLLLFDGSNDEDTDTKTSPTGEAVWYPTTNTKTSPGEALWNPTTNELKILPPSLPPLDPRDIYLKSSSMYFGFGFDSASEDYKVIRFLRHKAKNHPIIRGNWPVMAEVYSLAANSWHRVIIRALDDPGTGTHINGSYYWINSYQRGFIMSFNFVSEKFSSCRIHVPQSEKLDRCTFSNLKLVEFCGSLGAIVHSPGADPFCSFEVWVWDDRTWSWSLVSTFDAPISKSFEWSLVGSDKLIFVDVKHDMMFFDYATGMLENIGAPKAFVSGIFPFVESYVTLN